MNFRISTFLPILLLTIIFTSCEDEGSTDVDISDYSGTAMVTQGEATVTSTSLYSCTDGRESPLGIITDEDGNEWTVPADVNFTNSSFPDASDLYNPCTGIEYSSATEAIDALDGSDIVEIDSDGDLITAYIFADNYFEMYVNGVAVGKDNVPFTQFNSNIVRFRATYPFTVAMLLVDWEENSGLGSEAGPTYSFTPGDGGMVAVFYDESNNIIATTNDEWKAQTYYTSPIKDLTCTSESGSSRLSADCDTEGSNDGSSYFALHWEVPTDWFEENYDDSDWPDALTYTNTTIGVDNKPGYTNFTDIFDDNTQDAEFIWSSNLILDNEVLVRYTIE